MKIKRTSKKIALLLLSATVWVFGFALSAEANSNTREARPVQLHFQQVIGYGASVGYYLYPQFYLGLESFSMSDEGAILDIELDYRFNTNQMIGRYYPWDQYGFCMQFGLVSREWKISGSNETYVGNDTVRREATVEITWPQSAVSYGIGWFLIAEHGLSGGFGIGFISGASPKVKVAAPGASSADIDIEEKETAKTLENYTFFPYTHMSIGWNF